MEASGVSSRSFYFEEKQKKYKTERKSNLTPVSDVLDPIKKMLGLDEDFFIVAKVWEKELGIEGVEISGFKSGTIHAQTDSSAALHEVTIRKKEIIKKLNQYIGSNKIKNIKVTIK
ncbi:MAG: DUF721 domain-containing protein [Endomicrobia bacterium]|nr:DUF721 domain-containing protein [Endomicrobiia bacterium]